MTTISEHRPGIRLAGDAPLAVAAGTIVVGAAATTVFAPDMVTGSMHDHFPLAGLLACAWAAIAVAHLVAVPTRALERVAPWIAGVWIVATVVAIAGPELITGSDPTHIPITALVTPLMAAFTTTYLCVRAAVSARGERRGSD